MKEIQLQNKLNEFYGEFKNLPYSYNIEKVHQLLDNPNVRARHKVKFSSKPLKIIIMTSAFIIGTATFLFWFAPKNPNIGSNSIAKEPIIIYQNRDYSNTKKIVKKENKEFKINKSEPRTKSQDDLAFASNNIKSSNSQPETNSSIIAIKNSSICSWLSDTIIDKSLLLVNLSDEELKKIGITRKGIATFYHNICPTGECDWQLTCQSDIIPRNEQITTYNKFYVLEVTNEAFEPNGPSDFYSSMDTLIPVITNNQAGHVFWFTPNDNFFELLPERYSNLKEINANLKCLKRKYPKKTFTNFLNNGKEIIIESVNCLKLNKKELQNIGVKFDNDNIIFQTNNKNYTLKIGKTGSISSCGSDEDFHNFPPNPYPAAMTDTLGRRFFVQNGIIKKDSLSKIMNILVPVRINLNEVIPPNKNVMICWYYPTDDFLNSLPEKIGKELKSEVEGIINESVSASSCTYYEACKSTLLLYNFKLYPNPANYSVTIEFDLDKEAKGSISIVNISGARLKTLIPNTTFLSGKNKYLMNLSGITPGIYLISINTDRGFKTQRLIVNQ